MNDCRLLNQFLVLIAMFMLGSVQASAGENADLSFSAAPVRDVYREVAEVWGLEIRFESRLKHDRLSIELTDVNALTALQELQDAAGHAIVVRDDGSLMVMDDTPQNWRTYQSLEIYTFVPRYMEVEEIDKAFRSLFEARRISPGPTSGTLTIRDTAAKICVMREYLDRLDQAPAEIDVSVRVVGSNAALQGAAQARFSADEFERFMNEEGITELWTSGLTLVGHSRSMTKTEAPGDLKGQFELVVEGRHHHGSDDVTLNLDFEWTRPIGGQGGKSRARIHEVSQAVRLTIGESVFLELPSRSEDSRLVLIISPTLVRPSALDPESMGPFRVGTETRFVGDCGDPLVAATKDAQVLRAPVPIVRQQEPVEWRGEGYGGRPGSPVRRYRAATPNEPVSEDQSAEADPPPPR